MRDVGTAGEDLAVRYLVRRGWRILERNWRGGGGELDVVALRGGLVAFVEVKSRGDPGALGDPIVWAQRERLIRAATAYLARRPDLAECSARFDVITIDQTKRRRGRGRGRGRLGHLEDAFQVPVDPTISRPWSSKSDSSVYATERKERR